MKLIIPLLHDANTDSLAVTDGQNLIRYRIGLTSLDRKESFTLFDETGRLLTDITIKNRLFDKEALLQTQAGDTVTVRRKNGKTNTLPSFTGCDWAVVGDRFPEQYIVNGGYGKMATVKHDDDILEVELSTTAIGQDMLGAAFAIAAMYAIYKNDEIEKRRTT